MNGSCTRCNGWCVYTTDYYGSLVCPYCAFLFANELYRNREALRVAAILEDDPSED